MSFLLASAARATTGARSGQEDAYRLWPAEGVTRPKGEESGLLAVLADGMGGHTGGAIAGQTACATFADVFAAASVPYEERLQSALKASNDALAKGVEQNAALKGMGCTLIGAWIDAFGVRWTSVGDSLLLLYRFPDVIRLNADHSLGSFLDEQARQNKITASEAKQHFNRNALRSALTGSKIDLIDLRSDPMELRVGDWVLLASDGICSLEGDEIADVIYNYRQRKPEEMAEGLIAAVLKKGVAGQDNTTVVAVRIDAAPQAGSDLEPTRTMTRRGDDEEQLRSRRIGITGRKSVPQRRRGVRSVVWFIAAAMFFLFFAATVLVRSWQTAIPSVPETAVPRPQPALAAPSEPSMPGAPPLPAAPDAPRPPTVVPPTPPAPKAAMPPIGKPVPPAPKATPPDAPQPAAPRPPAQPAPTAPPQGTGPAEPPQTAPSDSQSPTPPGTPRPQSSEDERAAVPTKTKTRQEPEERRRPKRREQQAKEGNNKEAPKAAPKAAPKSAPADVSKEPAKPWGFGND